MTQTNQELKDHIFEIKTKISYLEKQILELEKESKSGNEAFSKLKERLELIKYDLAHKKDLDSIEDSLDKLNNKLNSVELELPEFRLVKKLILGMIAFILTAFLGLIWNTTISPAKKTEVVMDDIAKRIAEEYRKNGSTK
jgi:predicted nuclease with TOPRIM domain